jgi:dipeptidyl aminopeptidase/acylaminoacyl peptidase
MITTRTLALFAVLLCHSQATLAQTQGWTPELMMQVKRVGSPRPSPSGTHVLFTVATPNMRADTSEWVSQVWVARAHGRDAMQLTHGARSATAPAWSADGRWVAFLANRTGSNQIFRVTPQGSEPEQITNQKGGVLEFEWSPDDKSIAYAARDSKTPAEETAEREKRDAIFVGENPKLTRLYLISAEPPASGARAAKMLSANDVRISGLNWSPDSRTIVYQHTSVEHIWSNADISSIDVATDNVSRLVSTPAPEGAPTYSPDGKWIAYIAFEAPARGGIVNYAYVIPAAGGNARQLHKTSDEYLTLIGWSSDSKSVYFLEANGQANRLGRLPADGRPPELVSGLKLHITDAGMNSSGNAAAFIMEWSDTPAEAFFSTLPRVALRQVSKVQTLPDLPLPRTELVRWKSRDGKAVDGLLTYPVGYRVGTRVPLLTYVHGGPLGNSAHTFVATPLHFPYAAFAARGYAVLRPNFRASYGYGSDFRFAIVGDFAEGPFNDIMSGVDHVISLGIADPERLGIMGRSYGGYMAAWAISHTKRFKAAVAGSPLVNHISATSNTDIPDFSVDMLGGEFWDDDRVWREQSPIFHMKGVSTPTLIEHGDRDPRVHVSQAYELYYALKRQGVPVRLVIDPRQPHAIVEPKLQLDAMKRNLDWFDRWLKPSSRETSAERR